MVTLSTIPSSWVRALCSVVTALVASVVGFILLGFYLPVLIMEVIYGPWEDQPVGSGLMLLFFAVPIAILCLVAFVVLTRMLHLRLSPAGPAASGI